MTRPKEIAPAPFSASKIVLRSIIIASTAICIACNQKSNVAAPPPIQDLDAKLDKLLNIYYTGSRTEARGSVEQMLALIESLPEDQPGLTPDGAAQLRFSAWGRLYIIDRTANNENLAEADLINAHYWRLRGSKLAGKTDEQGGALLKSLTGDKCLELFSKLDAHANDMKGPVYLTGISLNDFPSIQSGFQEGRVDSPKKSTTQ